MISSAWSALSKISSQRLYGCPQCLEDRHRNIFDVRDGRGWQPQMGKVDTRRTYQNRLISGYPPNKVVFGVVPLGVFDGDLRLPCAAEPLLGARHHRRDVAGQFLRAAHAECRRDR